MAQDENGVDLEADRKMQERQKATREAQERLQRELDARNPDKNQGQGRSS